MRVMPIAQLVPAAMAAAFLATVFVIVRRRSLAAANAGNTFLERSGYRSLGAGPETYMVRTFAGWPVTWQQAARVEDGIAAVSCSWSVPLVRAPSALLHIADRRLVTADAGTRCFFSGTQGPWTPAYPMRIVVGDAELDARFIVHTPDEDAAQRALANPELRALLLACPEVDLIVGEREVRFEDAACANIRAAMGRSKAIERSLPAHDRIARVLTVAAAATA